MLCLGAQREHLVFREFSSARHVRRVDYCADWPLYRAIDFGYRSPLVCLWVQLTPAGCVHVVQEYVRAALPVGTHAREILRRDPGPVEMTYVDPAGRQREVGSGRACTDILAAGGIPCAWRGSPVGEGLELIREALAPAAGEPALFIHPRCEQMIDALGSYHYPAPGEGGARREVPVKDGPDHAVDALRYFFVNRLRTRLRTGRGPY
jgi:phage terminase large subunit